MLIIDEDRVRTVLQYDTLIPAMAQEETPEARIHTKGGK